MRINNGLRKLLYYSIFFGISGVVHYYFCFYQPDQAKVVQVPLAAITKAAKPEDKKPPEENKPEDKKADVKPPEPTPSELQKKLEQELEKRIQYQENLEKSLRQEFQHKMAEMEKQKQSELDKVKKELQQEQQKKLAELDSAKQKQEEMSQQLAQKMVQLNQQLAALETRRQEQEKQAEARRQEQEKQLAKTVSDLKQENEQRLQKTLQAKMQELEKKSNQELAQLKEAQERTMQAQERTWQEERKKSEKQLQDERLVLQQRQQDLERKMSRQQQELEQKMAEKLEQEKNTILARQGELEKQILHYKKILETTAGSNNTKGEREIINQQWNFLEKVRASSLNEHQAYIEKFTTTPGEGVKVPALDFQDENFKQKKYEVMAFHKMQLIAYQQAQHSFITIDLDLSPGRGRYRKRTDFQYLQNFSNRTISAEPVFPNIVDEIRRSDDLYDANEGPVYLAFVFPQKTANYLAWKSITVCKKFGYDPAKVTICQAHFSLTRNGYWSLIISRLRLADGRWVEVEDFEKEW